MEKSTQVREERPLVTEKSTQITPTTPKPLPESIHKGIQAETPKSSSIGVQHEPVRTSETSTQHAPAESLDNTTQAELVESSEVATQAEIEPAFNLEEITDRQLRELLRREYQIEDIVDIDVVRRQRVRSERDIEPLLVDELDVIQEVEEEIEELREAERKEPKKEEEEDEARFDERRDEVSYNFAFI